MLSAIVVNAVWKLMDFGALRRYAPVRRNDIVAAVVAAVGVLVFGPLNGLLLAVAASVLGLVYRSSRVDVEVMGKVPHEKAAWGSIRDHEERPTYPGVLVLRIDAPIFWVTAAADPRRRPRPGRGRARASGRWCSTWRPPTRWTRRALDALADLLDVAAARADIDLYLVRVMWPVRRALRRSGLMAELGEDHLWHSISQGVREARLTHGLMQYPATQGGVFDSDWLPSEEYDLADGAEERIVANDPGPEPGED